MKTLYIKIVLLFIGITLISAFAGLFATDIYYKKSLLKENEQRTIEVAYSIQALYEEQANKTQAEFMNHISKLGYQIYWLAPNEPALTFGSPFRRETFAEGQLETVMSGNMYSGMSSQNTPFELFGFFTNSLTNTIGIPVETSQGRAALFVRPDLLEQSGELRIIMAVMLLSSFLFSLILIIVMSRFIVKPIKQLTYATKQIAKGNYGNYNLQLGRSDEIGELARNFDYMSNEIKHADAMKQQFVSDVSHEFQTPLTSIHGLALTAHEPSITTEELINHMDIIANESNRLSVMSKQLLKLASLDQQHELTTTAFHLDEQIRQILIMLEWQWSDKQLELDLNLDSVSIVGNEALLYEVWQNLITNAIKFCNDKDLLSITLTEPLQENDFVEVIITDSGPGIPEEEIPYIFERFRKVSKSRSRTEHTGSGLGLSIAHKIVQLHHGNITVQSELGKGTTFTVKLPR